MKIFFSFWKGSNGLPIREICASNGFPFAGRYSLSELDNMRRGPTVIKERVRSVGGDMVIESTPGHGSRLEITIPQKGYESYG